MPKAETDVTTLDLFSEPAIAPEDCRKQRERERKKRWRERNPDKLRAQRASYRERRNERERERYLRLKGDPSFRQKVRERRSLERERERKRRQKERNPEAFLAVEREKQRRYRERHPDRIREKRQSPERREYMQQYAVDNREKINALHTASKRARPEITAWHSAKHRAKDLGREFTITKQWAADRYTGHCEMTGLAFVKAPNGKPWSYSPSIDRIDSAQGYTPENCRFVLWWVNRARGSDSDEIMNTIVRAYAAVQFS